MSSEMIASSAYASYIAKTLSSRQVPGGRRVMTYGTFDLFHDAHAKYLHRARELGTYLIVAVLTDIFDAGRGKRFLAQNVVQRIENVQKAGIADLVVLEECDDKINNILKYNVDVVAVFDSWDGPEAYVENMRRYCEVVFLPEERTYPSSTELRGSVCMGIAGARSSVEDMISGAGATGGVDIVAIQNASRDGTKFLTDETMKIRLCTTRKQLYECTQAIYLSDEPQLQTEGIRDALHAQKHVLCGSPLSLTEEAAQECFDLAAAKKLVLLESIPSAFTPAMERMTAIAQNGKMGRIISVALNLNAPVYQEPTYRCWTAAKTNSKPVCIGLVSEALLPIVRILYGHKVLEVSSKTLNSGSKEDANHIYQLTVSYQNATAIVTIGHGIIIPETLTVIGSEGYLTMPAPWREAASFHLQFRDVNFEEASDEQGFHFATRRGGYRFDLAEFATVIKLGLTQSHMVSSTNSIQIAKIIEQALACHE